MHAVVIPAIFNDPAAAKGELDELVSQISGMPGFVAGYGWHSPEIRALP
jgi:hypothetical protein